MSGGPGEKGNENSASKIVGEEKILVERSGTVEMAGLFDDPDWND